MRRIPPGRVATYGDVAAAAGNARAYRAVGNIMRDCNAAGVPCHRVIAAGGKLGGYGGNLELKRALLRAEGIPVAGSVIRGFSQRRWGKTDRLSPKPTMVVTEPGSAKRRSRESAATWSRRGRV